MSENYSHTEHSQKLLTPLEDFMEFSKILQQFVLFVLTLRTFENTLKY